MDTQYFKWQFLFFFLKYEDFWVDKDELLRIYRKRLTPENIMMYMDKARDVDIQMILTEYKIGFHLDKKTGKHVQSAIPQKVQDLIDARKAKYRESMTYILKTKYVWEYLKSNYPGKF